LHEKPHVPVAHVGVPWVTGGQAVPHALQLFGSVCLFVQVLAQRSGVAPEQPVTQEYVPALPWQSGADEPHAVLQPPQFAGFVMSTSQPSSPFVLQCA
jgi:hypothetical protein